MITGLESGIEALANVKRIWESNSFLDRAELVDRVILALRKDARLNQAPFLAGLAEAIEDGLIHAGE